MSVYLLIIYWKERSYGFDNFFRSNSSFLSIETINTLAPAGIFFGGSEVHQGRDCKGGRRVGGSGGGAPGRRRSFQKIWKKSLKNLQFLKNSQENFANFSIFFKFYRIFGENLDTNLENLDICICGGSGAEPPDASEFMEIWIEKSTETCNFCIVLHEFLPFFQIFKRILSSF